MNINPIPEVLASHHTDTLLVSHADSPTLEHAIELSKEEVIHELLLAHRAQALLIDHLNRQVNTLPDGQNLQHPDTRTWLTRQLQQSATPEHQAFLEQTRSYFGQRLAYHLSSPEA